MMQQAASTMLDGNGGSHVNDSFNIEIDGNNYTYVDYTNNEDSDDSDDNDSDYYEEEVSINHVPVATVLNDEKEVPINQVSAAITVFNTNKSFVESNVNNQDSDSSDNDSDYYDEEAPINHVLVVTVTSDQKEVPINQVSAAVTVLDTNKSFVECNVNNQDSDSSDNDSDYYNEEAPINHVAVTLPAATVNNDKKTTDVNNNDAMYNISDEDSSSSSSSSSSSLSYLKNPSVL